MRAIKECPFCGAIRVDDSKVYRSTKPTTLYLIECKKCGLRTALHKYHWQAVREWNRLHKYMKRDGSKIRKHHLVGKEF